MPCNCDHLNANQLEIELSRVLMLIEEVRTGIPVDPRSSDWGGYKNGAYNETTRAKADESTAQLCTLLKTIDVSKHSLELQLWWRDHQSADRKKL